MATFLTFFTQLAEDIYRASQNEANPNHKVKQIQFSSMLLLPAAYSQLSQVDAACTCDAPCFSSACMHHPSTPEICSLRAASYSSLPPLDRAAAVASSPRDTAVTVASSPRRAVAPLPPPHIKPPPRIKPPTPGRDTTVVVACSSRQAAAA